MATMTDATSGDTRFLVTPDCVRLARWLRVIGIDAEVTNIAVNIEYEKLFSDAHASGRIILTCDRKLASRRGALACFLVESNNINEQYQTVCNNFGLRFEESR